MLERNEQTKTKLEKLVSGQIYYIKNSADKNAQFKRYIFVKECGEKFLLFKTIKKNPQNEDYKECFLINDYVRNEVLILNKKEHKKYKSSKLWEDIDRMIVDDSKGENENGKTKM